MLDGQKYCNLFSKTFDRFYYTTVKLLLKLDYRYMVDNDVQVKQFSSPRPHGFASSQVQVCCLKKTDQVKSSPRPKKLIKCI